MKMRKNFLWGKEWRKSEDRPAPEEPSAIFPGIEQNVSQIEGPRPSAVGAPSIWYLWTYMLADIEK